MNDRYPDLYSTYQWFVPSQFNIAQACVHRWAENTHEGRRAAIHFENTDGSTDTWSYTRLSETSKQLANGLVKMGVRPGDRVAVVMEQRPEFVAACMAAFSVGAISVPLSAQSGPDGLGVYLRDAEARVAIVDAASGADLLQAQVRCPALTQIIGLGFQHDNILPWHSLLARQPVNFKPLPTRADSPALLLYRMGPNAKALGAIHAHSALIGVLPGFVASQNWFPQSADIFWSPADWVEDNGLLNALLPTLYFGRPIVAATGHFSATRALDILERYRVSNAFFTPSVLALIMAGVKAPQDHYDLALRGITTSRASLPTQLYDWCRRNLAVTPNELFSQSEACCVIGNSHQKWPAMAGSLGRPYPGHLATVLDEAGKPCPANVVGEIAINRYDIQGHPDPAVFQGYWHNDTTAATRFHGDWLLTGALATIDKQGYFWYYGQRRDKPNDPGLYIEAAEILLNREKQPVRDDTDAHKR